MDAREALTRKLGPLPVWAWGVGLGASINVGRWAWNRRKGDQPATDETTDDAAASSSDGVGGAGLPSPVGSAPSTSAGDYGYGNPGAWAPAGDATNGRPTTDAEWRSRATDALVADGHNALQSAEALGKYLANSPTTTQEQALISIAIRLVGVPPESSPQLVNAAPTPNVGAPVRQPRRPVTPSPAPTPATRRTLSQGSTGADVSALQTWLNAATGAKLTVDGEYGPRTAAAVSNLQQFMSRPGTWPGPLGVVDTATWGLIDFVAARNGVPINA